MSYTSADLIEAVKSIASIPSSQNLFTTADFLRFANRVMQKKLIPLILSTNEEYWVGIYDYSITANQSTYAIPSRAIGEKLRDVQYVDGTSEVPLPRLQPEFVFSADSGRQGFYIQGSDVILTPVPNITYGTLRLKYYQRPGKLVATTDVGTITAIDRNTNQVTVNATPTGFTVGTLCDFVKASPPYGWRAIDQAVTAVSSSVITFASLPTDLAVGDYVCLAGESPVPQIPDDLIPILEDEVAEMCMKAQGKNTKAFREELENDKREILKLFTPRVDGKPQKIAGRGTLLSYFRINRRQS